MTTTLKIYFNVIGMILFSIVSFGGIIPMLISADDWFLVSSGVVLLTVSPIALYLWIKKVVNDYFKNKEKE